MVRNQFLQRLRLCSAYVNEETLMRSQSIFPMLFVFVLTGTCFVGHVPAAEIGEAFDEEAYKRAFDSLRYKGAVSKLPTQAWSNEVPVATLVVPRANNAAINPNDATDRHNDATLHPNDATLNSNNAVDRPNDATAYPNDATLRPNSFDHMR